MWTLVRFVRIVYAKVPLEVRFAAKQFGTYVALEQHVWFHMPHLDMHLEDILVLQNITKLIKKSIQILNRTSRLSLFST